MPGRNIVYYQTIEDSYSQALVSAPVSHVYIAAVHVHEDRSFWLNDDPIDGPGYASLWGEWVPRWRAAGKSVLILLGGAGNGTWDTIMSDIRSTPPGGEPVTIATIGRLVQQYGIAGVDLDVETYGGSLVELATTVIAGLRTWVPGITVTMSPIPGQVPEADTIQGLTDGALAWANVQLYCDSNLAQTYESLLQPCRYLDAQHLVAGVDLDPGCCDSQATMCTYAGQVRQLAAKYPDFGGTAMWEFYDAFRNPPAAPWVGCAAQALLQRVCSVCS